MEAVIPQERINDIEAVLYGKSRSLSDALLHELITDRLQGKLHPQLQDVLDEYVEIVKARAV
jgi:hypothetical protein